MWLLIRNQDDLKPDDLPLRDKILELCSAAANASALALDFIVMVRERKASAFEDWLAAAKRSGLVDFRSFAHGLERDRSAVVAALSTEISNGQTEGHVNRLKFIKRAMFGRANFDLLRARVLNRSG